MTHRTKRVTQHLLYLWFIGFHLWFVLPPCSAQDANVKPFDWPQWQGPQRDNRSRETGLLPQWPKAGPKLLWQVTDVGGGYSTPTVAGGLIFGMSYVGDDEVVWARSTLGGKPVWSQVIASANREVDYHEGSRGSCTVDGDRLYALGVSGDLVCLSVAKGTILWRTNLIKDYAGILPFYREAYGYSESPLVDGDWVLVTPGGPDNTLIALDKRTGKLVWRCSIPDGRLKGGARADYSSIIKTDGVNGSGATRGTVAPHYIQFLHGGLVGVAPGGKLLWRWDKPSCDITNCSTPIFHDGLVFASSGYGKGGGAARLTPTGADVSAEEVWFNKHMKNHHGGLVLVDGYVYGASDPDMLACVELASGKLMWSQRGVGRGSIIAADGHLYYRSENGPMYLVQATPAEYVEKGKFMPPERSKYRSWCHPVIANGRLYLRDQNALQCYDVKR